MNIQNDLIADFARYAKSELDDHTAQLRNQYDAKGDDMESFKLKVFNEYFHSLKSRLADKMADMQANKSLDAAMISKLEKVYSQYIDDFLKKDFNKE